MTGHDLFKLFIQELEDMYSAEQQIIQVLPKMIQSAYLADLREALHNHLHETTYQIERLKKIFTLLDLTVREKKCLAMEGILKEADDIFKKRHQSPITDAAIISAAQKVEHYEIASYGTLRSFAQHLDLDEDVINLIQANLREEGNADKTLSRIAEGSFFTSGVNRKAAKAR